VSDQVDVGRLELDAIIELICLHQIILDADDDFAYQRVQLPDEEFDLLRKLCFLLQDLTEQRLVCKNTQDLLILEAFKRLLGLRLTDIIGLGERWG